jgi:hypothetical protein
MPDENVSNFESLDEALQAAELEVLSEITPELERDRQNLVSAFLQIGVARVELGKAIAAYHLHFKADRAWLRVTPVLLKWIGRTSITTLYNLIGDAERDQSLSGPRRAALKRIAINPATRRNTAIVEQLAGGQDDESSEAADQAVQVAVKASKAHLPAPKRTSSAAVPQSYTLDELAAEEIARADDFAKTHPEVNRETIASAVISSLQAWTGISASQTASTAPQTDRQENSKRRARDRSRAQKVVSMDGKPQRKLPKPEPTLFDLGAEQQELA